MLIVVVALCWNGSHKLIATYGDGSCQGPRRASTTYPSSSIYLLVLSPGHGTCTYNENWLIPVPGWPLSLSLSHMLIKMVSIYTTNLSVSQSNLISLFPLISNVAWALDSFVCWNYDVLPCNKNYVLLCNKNYEQNGVFSNSKQSSASRELPS
jgi:hypothetical protein